MGTRLTQKDWQLISEAIGMLLQDYPEDDAAGHPDAARLHELQDVASERGYRRQRRSVRVPNVPQHVKNAVLGRKRV